MIFSIRKYKKRYHNLVKALNYNKETTIYVETTTKNKDVVISYFFADDLLHLLMWDIDNFSQLNHHTRLNARFDEKQKSIKLLDVIVEEEYKRQGFGQKAMQVLIDLSVKKNFNKIFGELAESDLIDHKDVLVGFYKKLGFNIWLNSDNKYGELEKKLKV